MDLLDEVVDKAVAREMPKGAPPIPPEKPGAIARIGRGYMDTAQGIKQLWLMLTDPAEAERYRQEVNDEIALYERGRGQDAGFDWMRLAGSAASTAPVGFVGKAPGAIKAGYAAARSASPTLAGTLSAAAPTAARSTGRALAAATAEGAAAGATQYSEGGTVADKAIQTFAGGVGGAVSVPVAKGLAFAGGKIAELWAKTKGMVGDTTIVAMIQQQAGIPINQLTAEARAALVADVRRQLAAHGSVDGEALARKHRLESLGFRPTSGQVSRDPIQWQFEQNWSAVPGVGDDIRYQLAEQNNVLRRNLESVRDAQGGQPLSDFAVGDQIQTSVQNINSDMAGRVREAYKATEAAHGAKGAVTPENLLHMMGQMRDNIFTQGILESTNNMLRRFGLVDKAGRMIDHPTWQPALSAIQSEELRKGINALPDFAGGTNLKGFKARLIEALDDDIFDGLKGNDYFADARKLHAERKNTFATNPLERMTSQDGLHADKLYQNLVLGGNVHDLNSMRAVLEKSPEGMAAWANVRRAAAQDILDAAFNQDPTRKAMTEAGLRKMLDRIGPEKLEILFGKKTRDLLFANLESARDLIVAPPMTRQSSSNSATPLLQALMEFGNVPVAGQNPATAVVLGLAKKGEEAAKAAAVAKRLRQSQTGSTVSPAEIEAANRMRRDMMFNRIVPLAGPAAGSFAAGLLD